jgi:hypothetical protein
MRRFLKLSVSLAVAFLFAANASATYYVVLKNGTSYKAKAKWTIKGGKALVSLEDGQTLELDPALIDEAKSEQTTRSGLGDARVIAVQSDTAPTKSQSSLGSSFKLRKIPPAQSVAPNNPASSTSMSSSPAPIVPVPGVALLSSEIVEKFARAYENVGLFEQKLTASGPHSLRAELTADSEDKVFNAISATSFLMVRNAGVPGAQIEMVELFMKTTTGGSAGRFQMSRDDAQALDSKKMTQQDYFVHRVIF